MLPQTKIKVVIADDHEILRAGLKQILVEAKDIVVVGEARNGNEAIAITAKIACDVLLLDIAMPDKSGIDVVKIIHQQQHQLPILMLSMYAEDQYALRCLKAGAAGYLNKQVAHAELVKAVRAVAKGGKYISNNVAQILANHVNGAENIPVYELLSDREYQTLMLIGSGLTVSEIAAKLFLSVKTISVYRGRLLEKMGLKHNSDLMSYVIKNKLISAD